MDEERRDDDLLAERFAENGEHLRAVAYRMLGSRAEADDAVQEAWFRLSRSDADEIDNLRAWLTTVVFWHQPTALGIIISVVICVVASLNLFLDYEFIRQASINGAPKYMEWYGAFGIMVTLVWIYLEMLRLLSLLRR